MDAREAQKWLESRLKEQRLIQAENKIQGKLQRARISELQYRKLISLRECRFGANTGANRFVQDLIIAGYRAMITDNQSEYIEILWYRYRKQHKFEIYKPIIEITRFNHGLDVMEYECNPENDAYTIAFHDNPNETTFF